MLQNHLKIGSNIRKWRRLKDIEAKNFAQMLGITTGALSNIENNITNLTLSRISEIAELLNIAPEKLFVDPLSLLPPPR